MGLRTWLSAAMGNPEAKIQQQRDDAVGEKQKQLETAKQAKEQEEAKTRATQLGDAQKKQLLAFTQQQDQIAAQKKHELEQKRQQDALAAKTRQEREDILNGKLENKAATVKAHENLKLAGITDKITVPFDGTVKQITMGHGKGYEITDDKGHYVRIARRDHGLYGEVNIIKSNFGGKEKEVAYLATDKFGEKYKGKPTDILNSNNIDQLV